MSDNGNETPIEGTEGGADEIMRQVFAEGRRSDKYEEATEDPRERVKRIMDRANDRNAQRPEAPHVTPRQMLEASVSDMRHRLRPSDGSPEYGVVVEPTRAKPLPSADDTSDPTKPVLGTSDLIEEIVATTQRYGAFAHWPKDKKAEALGIIERVVKQRAIAQQVVAVTRRDSIQARAYRERNKLAKEARLLLKHYYAFGNVAQVRVVEDPVFHAEAINYLARFVQKVADLPAVPGEEESSDGES